MGALAYSQKRFAVHFFWGGYVFSEIPPDKNYAPGEEVDRSIAGFPGKKPGVIGRRVSAGVALREDRKTP